MSVRFDAITGLNLKQFNYNRQNNMEFNLGLLGNYSFVYLGRGSSEYPRSWSEMDQSYPTTSGDGIDCLSRTRTNYSVGDSAVVECTSFREEIPECASPTISGCFTDYFGVSRVWMDKDPQFFCPYGRVHII
jgi:hypothetical protein